MTSLVDRPLADPVTPLISIINEKMADNGSAEGHRASSEKRIRRTRSFRTLRRMLPSSESLGSEEDSIYNAEAVLSTESLPSRDETPKVDSATTAYPLHSPSHSHELSASHSRWPTPQLHPIMEQNDLASLRTSHSLPRLRASPERRSLFVQPQNSIHSIHANRWKPPRAKGLPTTALYRRRSLSLNDLDSGFSPEKNENIPLDHSSSSDDALDRRLWSPSFPIKPVQAPPHRIPTPPGLPSFGTQQATEIRLNQHQPNGRTSFWNRLWRHSLEESDEQMAASPSLVASPPLDSQNHPNSPPGEIFKRTLAMIGMSRMVDQPASSSSSGPRASLPPGVYTTNTPGPLARADDGTLVRGKFGPRASGHGIGSRNIESHPISRLGQLSAIEEQVRDIDKACERADFEHAILQSMSGDSGQQDDFGLPSPLQASSPAHGALQRTTRRLHPGSDQNLSPPIYVSPPGASESRFDLGHLMVPPPPLDDASWFGPRRNRRPEADHLGLHPSAGYVPSTLLSLRSLDSDTGLPSLADEAERTRVREMVMSEKRREQRKVFVHMWYAVDDCCHDFWQMACVGCCVGK